MAVDFPVAIPTLIGSLLSTLGAGFILICYAFLPKKLHFRHALIINLAISDFLNAANGSISGIIIIANNHDLRRSPFCTFNGWLAQITVQATDLNILAIAIVTVLTIRRKIVIADDVLLPKILICLSVWIIPAITSFTALGLHAYRPVSGNWCWIEAEPVYYRYVLTHGWRFMVIILSTIIYVYIYIHLYRHFQRFKNAGDSWRSLPGRKSSTKYSEDIEFQSNPDQKMSVEERRVAASAERRYNANNAAKAEAMVKRTLLLNAYPIMYIILWIPGIANRVAEATGHHSQILTILQASTQFVGLANAITYGINEKVVQQLRDMFTRRSKTPLPQNF